MARYRIKSGLLKGVGLKGRHRRLLKREFKKTLKYYVGSRTALAAGTAVALVGRKMIKALPGKNPLVRSLSGKSVPDKKQI